MSKDEKYCKSKTLFTVGQLAKRMDVTPRTIQYYDKEGLLKPKEKSESGRRLYSDAEVVKLYQITSLKELGFSLDDIKHQLANLDTPKDVAKALQVQKDSVDEKIAELQDQKRILTALQAEVMKRDDVDFTRYADIITSLHMSNEFYWAITHMDKDLLNQLRGGYDSETFESTKDMVDQMGMQRVKALRMLDKGICPNSPAGQELAKDWWETCMNVVHGDIELLGRMSVVIEEAMNEHPELDVIHARSLEFIGPALHAYLESSANEEVIAQAQKLAGYLQDAGKVKD